MPGESPALSPSPSGRLGRGGCLIFLLCPWSVRPQGHGHSAQNQLRGLQTRWKVKGAGLGWRSELDVSMGDGGWGTESEGVTVLSSGGCLLPPSATALIFWLACLKPNPRAVVSSPSSTVCWNFHLPLALLGGSFSARCKEFLAPGGETKAGVGVFREPLKAQLIGI